jgi:bifunctional N-acetylglucosamine-1-phosphate-uridyltransferase/glucosamine-1-phosphate-acetyltransferase GlmU-like protein
MRALNWVLLAVLLVVVPAVAASADSVLIIGSEAGNIGSYPTAELAVRGFTTVGTFDTTSATPAIADLSPYDSVLMYTDYPPNDPTTLGNVLADYADLGKRLVIATYAFSDPWAIGGRIMTSGYSPLTNLGVIGLRKQCCVLRSACQ